MPHDSPDVGLSPFWEFGAGLLRVTASVYALPMCGRYALYGPHSRLREQMLLAECPEYGERYNIAPQSNVLVVRFRPAVGRVGQLAKWGLIPSWAKEPSIGHKLNNARGETVAEKPVFRSSFAGDSAARAVRRLARPGQSGCCGTAGDARSVSSRTDARLSRQSGHQQWPD